VAGVKETMSPHGFHNNFLVHASRTFGSHFDSGNDEQAERAGWKQQTLLVANFLESRNP